MKKVLDTDCRQRNWNEIDIINNLCKTKSGLTGWSALLAYILLFIYKKHILEWNRASDSIGTFRVSFLALVIWTDGYMQQWAIQPVAGPLQMNRRAVREYAWAVTWPRVIRRRAQSVGPLRTISTFDVLWDDRIRFVSLKFLYRKKSCFYE